MEIERIKKIISQQTPELENWKGAVLFLFNESEIFLIQRAEHMPSHAGQIAFFGGHKQQDETSPFEVVLREFEEESGISSKQVELLGFLPMVMTARMQPVIPVLGYLKLSRESFFEQLKSNGEWDKCLAYPWDKLKQQGLWQFAWRHGYTRSAVMFHAILPGTYNSSIGKEQGHLLWGATAQMVWSLLGLYFKP
jgi:8-oxo-dGTP pyrophosphatase MutT (NUDIX family)